MCGDNDIMILVETKLDNSYPTSQFLIDSYSAPFRRDRNKSGGGILVYVREDIPCKLLNLHRFPDDIEGLFLEVNLRKTKILLFPTFLVSMINTIFSVLAMLLMYTVQNMKNMS